jgi:phosphate transport system permease protein
MTTTTTTTTINLAQVSPRRRLKERAARAAFAGFAALTVAILVALVATLVVKGMPHVDWRFLSSYPSRFAARAGILPAIVGTVWIGVMSMVIAIPVGIAAAVYLQEFAPHNRVTALLRASISNLAGVPSVVFGLLGLALFVRILMLGKSILAAGLTLALLTLPIIVVVAEEALKTVPRSMREAAFGLGASRWQVVRHHVLPYALPGMLTGSILALSRSMGETAPIILIGAATYITYLPEGPTDSFTALPIQAYSWAFDARVAFHDLAFSAVLVLLVITFLANLVAVVLRDVYQRRYRW